MSFKAIIIEDEQKSVYVLEELIRQFAPDLFICGNASHTDAAIRLIEAVTPDLVFLDVRIGDGTGFDVLQQVVKRNFELVFITAYDNYALDAFRFSAINYLLKPVGINEFEQVVAQVRKRLTERRNFDSIEFLLNNFNQQFVQSKKINIPTLNGYDFIELSSIIWLKSEGAYTIFYLTDKSKITSTRNIGSFENLLTSDNFCRIHNSVMINMQQVKSYSRGKGGYVIMSDGMELELSQRRKGDFLNRLMI